MNATTLTTDEVLDAASQGSQNAVSESINNHHVQYLPPSSELSLEKIELLDSSSQSIPGVFDFQENIANAVTFDLKYQKNNINSPSVNNDCPLRISSEEIFSTPANLLKRKLTDSQELSKRPEKRLSPNFKFRDGVPIMQKKDTIISSFYQLSKALVPENVNYSLSAAVPLCFHTFFHGPRFESLLGMGQEVGLALIPKDTYPVLNARPDALWYTFSSCLLQATCKESLNPNNNNNLAEVNNFPSQPPSFVLGVELWDLPSRASGAPKAGDPSLRIVEQCDKCKTGGKPLLEAVETKITGKNGAPLKIQVKVNEQCAHRSRNPHGAPERRFIFRIGLCEITSDQNLVPVIMQSQIAQIHSNPFTVVAPGKGGQRSGKSAAKTSGKDFLELLISHVKSLEQRIDSAIKGFETSMFDLENKLEARVSALEYQMQGLIGEGSSSNNNNMTMGNHNNHNMVGSSPNHMNPFHPVSINSSNANNSNNNNIFQFENSTALNQSTAGSVLFLDHGINNFYGQHNSSMINNAASLMIKMENENSNENSLRVSGNFHAAFLATEEGEFLGLNQKN